MPDLLAVTCHVPELGRPRVNRRTLDLQADELPPDAFLLDPLESLFPDEVRLLVEVDEPAEVHLVRIVLERHVGSVIQDARLDPADLRRSDRPDLVLLPRVHDPIPQLDAATPVTQVDFVPYFRGPPGPCDDDRNPVDVGIQEMVVPE